MSKAVVLRHLRGSNYLQELQESWSAASDITSVTINAKKTLGVKPKRHFVPGCGDSYQKHRVLKFWKEAQPFIYLEDFFFFKLKNNNNKLPVTNEAYSYVSGNKT